jgi:nucleotide-binding universal stress UspA family protein
VGERDVIVVALDGSKTAEAAVPPAMELARLYQAPLRLVHVLDPGDYEGALDVERGRALFKEYTSGVLAEMEDLPEVTTDVLTGSPPEQLLEYASEALFLVMATHGKGGFKASFIGSVTDRVVRAAKVPVLALPVGGDSDLRSGPVLVGLDGSPVGEQALPVARDLAKRLGVPVALLRAYEIPPATGSEFVVSQGDVLTEIREAAEEYIAGAAQSGERALVIMRSAAPALVETSDEIGAGLVVLTSHGKGFMRRIALGSTTDRVLHSIKRPLLVLPAKAEGEGA